ncbi:hypothetical protein JTY93_23680 [Pseudomonas hygromyciniae]|uniref:Uncharacterized protein n=1 Tax=Pseudomonas hygromyciniae TaxID=2812000 RepID=A0ABX7JVI6_9PSED|nr:hypothetical protein [Pseudomonas hygromyciniae]QSB39174.1 hypothetical protein JTY93_23680 [Pseudomonas hygromyciniae]
MLLASDEAALYLMLRTAMIWLSALLPSQVAGKTAEVITGLAVSLLIDLLIALVLTIALQGAGIAYLGLRLAKYGSQVVELAVGFVKGVFDILKRFTAAVDRYKAVAVRGVVGGLQKVACRCTGGTAQYHAQAT